MALTVQCQFLNFSRCSHILIGNRYQVGLKGSSIVSEERVILLVLEERHVIICRYLCRREITERWCVCHREGVPNNCELNFNYGNGVDDLLGWCTVFGNL